MVNIHIAVRTHILGEAQNPFDKLLLYLCRHSSYFSAPNPRYPFYVHLGGISPETMLTPLVGLLKIYLLFFSCLLDSTYSRY